MKKLLAVAFIGLLCSPVFAENQNKRNSNHYEAMTKEYCKSGESGQDVNACLKEMKNTKGEKLRGVYDYKENVMKRCADFADNDKSLCEDRLMHGNKSGSVKEGGTITELTLNQPSLLDVPEIGKD